MKTLYIECKMGAAGDMLMSALYELLDDRQQFLDTMNSLGLPGVHLEGRFHLRHRRHPHGCDGGRGGRDRTRS